MGEQATEERIAEINRKKEEYEARERTHERDEENEKFEAERRRSLAEQEGRERREEAARKQQEREEVEASAERIAAGRKHYREEEAKRQSEKSRQDAEVEASAPKIAEIRRKYREQKEVEDSAPIIAAGRKKFREEQIAREGGTTDHVLDWSLLSPHEKKAANEEIEKSAVRIKRDREVFVAKKKDEYYRKAPTGTQILDIMMGNKTPYREKPAKKQAEPINTFFGGQKQKAKERLELAKVSFIQELTRPPKAIQEGRKQRAIKQQVIRDPLAQLAPPQPRRASRSQRGTVPMGSGLLFSEGFFNPPKGKTGRKTKSGGSRRGRTGTLGDMLL